MKRVLAILLAAAVLTCMALPALAAAPEAELYEAVRGQAGVNVSGFSAELLGGGNISGEVFGEYSLCIVTYWAAWSGDALRQLEYLNSLHELRPDIGVMGILNNDAAGSEQAAMDYMQAHGYEFPVFTADAVWSGVISQAPFLPQSFYVSPSGIILEAFPGAFSSMANMLEEASNWVGPHGTYCVRFYDSFGGAYSLIAQYKGLVGGASVVAPEPPSHEGAVFIGWSSNDLIGISSDLEVFAVYSYGVPDGDADCSGGVDSLDVLLVLRIALGILPVQPQHLAHADMDLNGVINADDALLLLRKVLGIV